MLKRIFVLLIVCVTTGLMVGCFGKREGILEYYKELFSVQDGWQVLGLLKILADDNYKGHTLCPCGSGQKLRNCHGNLLREIKEYQKPADFYSACSAARTPSNKHYNN